VIGLKKSIKKKTGKTDAQRQSYHKLAEAANETALMYREGMKLRLSKTVYSKITKGKIGKCKM